MRRILVSLIAALLVAAVSSPVLGQADSGRKEREARQSSGSASGTAQTTTARPAVLSPEEKEKLRERLGDRSKEQLREVEEQISQLKAEHEELIKQLNAVRESAVKEKAGETAKQLEKVLSKQREAFQEKLKQLEQRHQKLQRAVMGRVGRADQGQPTGRKAPEFTLKTFDGKTVSLSDYKGKIVVLEWFNMECPFVQYHYDKVKTMIDLANKYKDKNVVWLVVNSTSHTTPEANKEFTAKHSLPYPILDDRSGKVGKVFGARTTPQIFVINADGRIMYDGAIDNSPLGKQKEGVVNYADKALSELIAGKAVSTGKTESYGCPVKYPQ
jgi:peroxiredoxin